MDLIVDTTFLVGLWRRQPWALDFAVANRSTTLGIPWVVLGEFWHGATRAGHAQEEVKRFLDLGIPVWDPAPVIQVYAKACASLQEEAPAVYRSIGQNDLWIAAVAIHAQCPLLSRNQRYFDKISRLKLIALENPAK